jgi:hypothetical protein
MWRSYCSSRWRWLERLPHGYRGKLRVAKSIAMLLVLVAASCAHSAPRQPASQPQAATQPATPEPAATPVAPAMPVAPATPQPATAAASPPSETTPTPAAQAAGNASPLPVARPAATAAAPKPNPAAPPVAAPKPAAPRVAAAPPAAAPSVAAPPAPVASPTLDLNALKEQLKETKAIGVFTKISLKNQVDDLMKQFREYYQGKTMLSLKQLRQSYDLLMVKVLSLLQDTDKKLASAIVSSREAIWGLLSDQKKFDALEI